MISKLVKNAGALYLLQGVNVLAPFMVIPFLTRMLSVNQFGIVMIAFAVLQICFVITDYGFSLSATYEISEKGNDVRGINEVLGDVFTAKIPLIIVALILLLLLTLHPSYSGYKEIFYAGIIAVIVQAFQPLWFFHGIQKMFFYSVYMSLSKIIYVLLVLLLVRGGGDGWLVIMSWSIANLCGMAVALASISHLGYSIKLSSVGKAIKLLKDGSQFFWSRVGVASYTAAASLLVGMSSLHQAAMYSASEQIYKGSQAFTTPVNQALYPYMAKEKNWNFFFKVIFLITILLAMGACVVGFFGGEIIFIVFGEGYEEAEPILMVFLLIGIVNYLASSFGYPASAALGRVDIANKTVIFGALFFIVMALIMKFNDYITGYSIVILILCTELIVMALRIFLVMSSRSKNNVGK